MDTLIAWWWARGGGLGRSECAGREAAEAIGMKTSPRNSEVIHSGIYYPHGLFKARLCVLRMHLLYAYCAERGIGHHRCDKLIDATSAQQVAELQGILATAEANGVDDLVMLTRELVRFMEPELNCLAALHAPSTGIVVPPRVNVCAAGRSGKCMAACWS